MYSPLVSVIVPNYNHEKYLKQRLESIFKQSYTNFEVILLDDCSTDNSKDILLEYEKHPKVSTCIYNDNNSGNTFLQWQKGISIAKGDYIWIAESDDFCDETFLEILLQPFFKDKNVTLVYCQSNVVDKDGVITGNWLSQTDKYDKELFLKSFILIGNKFIKKFLIYKNVIPNASAVVFRKSTNKQLEYLETAKHSKYIGDWIFYIQLIINNKIGYEHKLLNNFRHHNTSVIAKVTDREDFSVYVDIGLEARSIVTKILGTDKSLEFQKIIDINKQCGKEMTYKKAMFLIRNNNKLKGALLLTSVLDVFIKEYKFKKNLQLRLNRLFNLDRNT